MEIFKKNDFGKRSHLKFDARRVKYKDLDEAKMISSEGVKVILNTVYTFIELLALLLSVFGNFLVIYVRRKKLKTKSNCYIVSVAIADLVNGSLGISFNLFTVRIMKVTKSVNKF